MSLSPLLILPPEVIHHIIDYLDYEDILWSLRYVCRDLKEKIESYNRYRLDYRCIPNVKFKKICSLIRPENVISLILADDDAISSGVFLTQFNIKDFTRLYSLTLIRIREKHLIEFLQHLSPSTKYLSIEHQDSLTLSHETIELHSSILTKVRLSQLHMVTSNFIIINMRWPADYAIQNLALRRCSCKQYLNLLRCLPNLHTLELLDFSTNDFADTFPFDLTLASFSHVKSLTITSNMMLMEMIRLVISLTRSIHYLKLSSLTRVLNIQNSIFDGSQWANFIETNLSELDKFEFLFQTFHTTCSGEALKQKLQTFVTPFQTSFWREHKHWFVNCTCIKGELIELYSIPLCQSNHVHDSKDNLISCSTLVMTPENETAMMDNVSHLSLALTDIPIAISSAQTARTHEALYRRTTHLRLRLNSADYKRRIWHLSSLVDMAYLRQISLSSKLDKDSNVRINYTVDALLKQTVNIRKLQISFGYRHQYDQILINVFPSTLLDKIIYVVFNTGSECRIDFILDRHRCSTNARAESLYNLDEASVSLVDWLKVNNREYYIY
ncbi:unnamed protein product [Adineta ricciae]|uniref:F-box domain-containing protein n=1 Tax=Adineta ricciae TaxID=249248 RepID=A0A815EH11_ADIRI|nr:unnamed protein product [Adineta ricciae]CAF1314664.1 unnamed protein product [Adineta ricciae]